MDISNENSPDSSFRIKNVSEINSECNSSTSSSNKRKIPNWLSASEEVVSADKRQRIDESSIDNSANEVHEENINNEDESINKSSEIIESTENTNDAMEKLEVSTHDSSIENTNEAETVNSNTTENETTLPQSNTTDPDQQTNSPAEEIKVEVKTEPEIKTEPEEEAVSSTEVASTSNTNAINVKQEQAVKEEASSTTLRDSCKYGIRCYRRNPQHRIQEAHPGDADYRRPDFPPPPKGTPDCPFGDLCYRRNPSHFRDFSHPPSTDFHKNWQNHQNRLRDRKPKIKNDDDLDDNEYDLTDGFIDDGSEDEFIPTDDEDSEEEFE